MSNILRLLAALLATPMLIGVAAAEDAVLLSSTAPGYSAGMVVLDTDRLNVPEGASLTLLFQSGDVLRIGGPFEGTIQPPQASGSDTGATRLAALFRAQGTDASVIGGTRSTGSRLHHTDADDVLVDPRRSGTYCIGSATSVWIARPDADKAQVSLRRKGSSRALAWPADVERIEWPADVPIDDQSQFEIETGGKVHSTVTFRTLPADQPSDSARVAKGIVLGCQDQFDGELRRIGMAFVPPELWITTNRGRHPVYHAGDAINLTVTVSVDGYVYCVAEGEGGSATPIFPAGAVDGAQLRASTALSLPGRRQPGGLVAGKDLQKVQCWLADRNISAELPSALVGGPSRRLPDRLAGDLDGLFSHVGGTRLATAVLPIGSE
ncbi:MAG TPA: DUF4384 domain-containing protein [Rhodopila sp.]|nr:DUF4384 domain-containing protein [Rhodopila sp.]